MYVGKFPDDRGFFFLPTISDSAYISDKACFWYVGKIPDDRGFYFFSTIPDFAYIPDNRQKTVPDSPYYELAGKWKECKNRVLNKNLTAFIQQHWCTRAYAATFSIDDRGFYFFATIPDFAYVSDNRQKTVPDSPYYELGGKWKVCKKSSLEQKCNSIYTATLMHTSLCCVVLNTSLFLHPSMQGFPFWKSRGQLKIPYHSSSFLSKRLEIAMTRIFEKQKSGTRWENGNAVDSPDFFPSIPDDREYLQFLVFISRQNLGQSGNSKIPDCLVFSRHI